MLEYQENEARAAVKKKKKGQNLINDLCHQQEIAELAATATETSVYGYSEIIAGVTNSKVTSTYIAPF